MPQLPLFYLKNPPLGRLYSQVLLSTFALFMVMGNFFRLIPLPFFPSNISLLELLLYILALPLYLGKFRNSFFLVIAIFSSNLYGTILHGFDLTSTLYACKLAGMIGAGVVVGEALETQKTLVQIFTWILGLGICIFVFFPKAHALFALLEGMGIRFFGDPHERRFISTFFDPNYYAAIAILPLMITWRLRETKKYFFLFCLFFLSILLTFSRSGIGALFMTLFGGVFFSWQPLRFRPLRLFVPFLLLCLPFVFFEQMIYFFERTLYFLEDPSALSRFATFQFGLQLLLKVPLFGIGYNFLFYFSDGRQLFGVDSSMLSAFVTFGLIPTLAFALFGVFWIFKRWKTSTPFFQWLYFYLLISILFTSQFNNLIFYPFWLIPMIALFVHENRIRP